MKHGVYIYLYIYLHTDAGENKTSNKVDMLHVRLTELHAAHQTLPCYLLNLLITMESSISHCFDITGWRKYAHQRIKFSTVVKLLCISIHTPHSSYLS